MTSDDGGQSAGEDRGQLLQAGNRKPGGAVAAVSEALRSLRNNKRGPGPRRQRGCEGRDEGRA